jgi:nicotinamide phosphoribosyltransferase
MKRFLETFEDATVPAIACVSDSFNIFRACEEYWGGALRAKVLKIAESGKVLVVRPDSGEPAVVVRQVIETLDKQFGHTVNDKGFKVLNGVRVIQGDGITLDSIKRIIDELEIRGWSIDNIAFGMGGALLQQVNRDTLKFAFKASSMIVNGQVRDIYKDPITDTGKRSKRGRLKLINLDGVLTTVNKDQFGFDILETVYEDGEILVNPTFADIRTRAALPSNS